MTGTTPRPTKTLQQISQLKTKGIFLNENTKLLKHWLHQFSNKKNDHLAGQRDGPPKIDQQKNQLTVQGINLGNGQQTGKMAGAVLWKALNHR